LTLHQRYEPGTNGQTDARSPEFARRGSVNLFKGVEDDFLVIRIDPNTCIRHLEPDRGSTFDFRNYLCSNLDAPRFCKLHRIANQIEQDLSETQRISQ